MWTYRRKPARLAADDERHLGVNLHVGEAVHDVDARLLELARPFDVPPLVEPRFQLDEADRLLALLGAVDQRRHQRAVVGGAVDRRLHRDHVGIGGSGCGERLEARPEGLVRLVHEQVAAPDLVEEPAASLTRARRGCVTGTHGSSLRSGRSTRASCMRSARSSGPSISYI